MAKRLRDLPAAGVTHPALRKAITVAGEVASGLCLGLNRLRDNAHPWHGEKFSFAVSWLRHVRRRWNTDVHGVVARHLTRTGAKRPAVHGL
jgi:hypothetical protein